jgi:predicted ATPase
VGRDTEVARLVQAVDQVRGGRLTVVHVTGEHGIGKSRLTRELEVMAVGQGFRVARVQCRPDTRRTPLWAWSRLVRDLSGDPATDIAAPWDAASTLLEEVADEPTLLVLDDAHWSDDLTLRALDHLLRDEPRAPLLLTISQRLRTLPQSYAMSSLLATLARVHAEHLALAGVSPEATGKLLGSVCGARTHPRVAEGACERMDGNPFLLIELARHGELAPAALPASIRAVVTHHLSRVPEQTLNLLEPASLLARTWDADFLAMAADVDVEQVLTVMTAAVAGGVLVEEHDDRYTFVHQVVRELLTSGLSRPAKARWHAAFATVLEERTPLDRPDRRSEMDRHWREAGYPFARRAWQAQVGAARRASDDGLVDEADRLLEHAAASLAMDREATEAERHLLAELRRSARPERDHSRRADPVRSA